MTTRTTELSANAKPPRRSYEDDHNATPRILVGKVLLSASILLASAAAMIYAFATRPEPQQGPAVSVDAPDASVAEKLELDAVDNANFVEVVEQLQATPTSHPDVTDDARRAALKLWSDGMVQYRAGNVEAARKLYEQSTTLNPHEAGPWSSLGRVVAQFDRPAARKYFERALSADSSYVPALLGLTTIEIADRNLEAAKQYADRVLDKQPNNPDALKRLARIEALKNQR